MKIKKLREQIKNQNKIDFNYYGGITMYAYKFSDEFNLDKKSKHEEVMEKLKKIDSKYSLNKISDIEKNSSLREEKTAEKHVNKSKNLEVDAKKTIFEDALKEIESDKIEEEQKAKQIFDSQIFRLENERSLLEEQQNMALASFDISYAVKIAGEIQEINNEILKMQNEFAESKNSFDEEQEIEENQNDEIANKISEYGQENVDEIKFQEKYEIVKEFLNTMPKQEAISELENKKYKSELGELYETLYAEIYSREK